MPKKPRVMVDANVVIFATRTPSEKDSDGDRQKMQDSKTTLMKQSMVRMSAVSFGEVMRRLKPEEQEAINHLGAPLFPEALTGEMARLASVLINFKNPSEDLCSGCQNQKPIEKQEPCGECGGLVSPQQRLDDAFIVATALLSKDVDTLVSEDKGVLKYALIMQSPKLKKLWPTPLNLRIVRARDLDPLPLLSREAAPAPAPVPSPAVAKSSATQ